MQPDWKKVGRSTDPLAKAQCNIRAEFNTIGAIAGLTMRGYIDRPEGRQLFYRTYDEALSVALASGVRPELSSAMFW
jgi:hypothetical protein